MRFIVRRLTVRCGQLARTGAPEQNAMVVDRSPKRIGSGYARLDLYVARSPGPDITITCRDTSYIKIFKDEDPSFTERRKK